MAKYLPLFPLEIVVFPGEKLNLHIFEPRYKQLVLDCITNNTSFGIPTFIDNKVGEYGTEVKILQIEKKYDNGEMDIRTKGVSIFKVKQFDKQAPGRLYAGGEVKKITDEGTEDIVTKLKIKECMQKLHEVLGLRTLFLDLPEDFKSYDIAHHLGLSVEQEYLLLQLPNESDRQELLLQHLITIIPIVEEAERLKVRVKQNGHFKNLTPPNF
ncbi:LON peptidase substrate-binding domain-containing protein [Pontibacter harenae]|uniref:LON peptidase substrate-binding domain-containing protein n=1 Tax=Pontibacter harenae TaxID=2894083 RepID=UPI001E59F535|nr:LON peptidase substrate-binding domain-containing protein [Pontibacter harenae]MCC9167628.1 LON peptidase substrate-binding domain-containing protein [Pontibacter harenae]